MSHASSPVIEHIRAMRQLVELLDATATQLDTDDLGAIKDQLRQDRRIAAAEQLDLMMHPYRGGSINSLAAIRRYVDELVRLTMWWLDDSARTCAARRCGIMRMTHSRASTGQRLYYIYVASGGICRCGRRIKLPARISNANC